MKVKLLPNLTVKEYLVWERDGEVRHDYIDGRTYAMTGGSANHNKLSLRIASILLQMVRDKPCEVFINDMKIRIKEWNAFYYPDAMLCCDPDDNDNYFRTSPCLIIEVLSPGTAGIDRREKLAAYQTLRSLQEYVLIEQDKIALEIYRRTGNTWTLEELNEEDRLRLECLDTVIPVPDIYEGVIAPG